MIKLKNSKYGFIVYSFGGYNFKNKREAKDFKRYFWKNKKVQEKIRKIYYPVGIPDVLNWKESKKVNAFIYY